MTKMKIERAKRAIAQTPQVTDDEQAVAHFAGCNLVFHGSWGSARKASLHPRLYAIAALRGLWETTYKKFNQSFLKLIGHLQRNRFAT